MNLILPTRKLLWIDASAASLSCLFTATLKAHLSSLFNLSENLLSVLALTAFCYAIYALILIYKKVNKGKLLSVLAVGNTVYGLVCLYLFWVFINKASLLGLGFIAFDFLAVMSIAFLEFKNFKF